LSLNYSHKKALVVVVVVVIARINLWNPENEGLMISKHE
jgi:hypothetical protein